VTVAKREVFGSVGIDALRPSETIVIADGSSRPDVRRCGPAGASEHDELATPILLTPSDGRGGPDASGAQLKLLDREQIARTSFDARGGGDRRQHRGGGGTRQQYAPEHMCLLVRDAAAVAKTVRNAGGIFVGDARSRCDYTRVEHVMPTSGAARVIALGVHDS
jgi:histidinol dehydrogenase